MLWNLVVRTLIFFSCTTMKYKDDVIAFVDEYKYLDVVLNDNGKLKYMYACEDLAGRARKAYFIIKSKLPKNHSLSGKVQYKIYESCIMPILTYASEIWISGFRNITKDFDKTPFETKSKFYLERQFRGS